MVSPLMYIQSILARMQMLSGHMLDLGVELGPVETGAIVPEQHWSLKCNAIKETALIIDRI